MWYIENLWVPFLFTFSPYQFYSVQVITQLITGHNYFGTEKPQ